MGLGDAQRLINENMSLRAQFQANVDKERRVREKGVCL